MNQKDSTKQEKRNFTDSPLYQKTFVGIPLVVAGLITKGEDTHFRALRNDYMQQFHRPFDNYTQYIPGAVMLGMKMAGGMLGNFGGMNGMFGGAQGGQPTAPQGTAAGSWTCSCGQSGNTGRFCAGCGQPKPEVWTCACGQSGNTGRFCAGCGQPKPEAWTCSCGQTGNTGRFCAGCGQPRMAGGWTCPQCGKTGNTGRCCPDCGTQKPN
ncbi:MAG TPA: hypothetical protein DDW30_09600 [Clostridiales bacterium]|nr:hypothetical protein [Clostridiales bacterium]